MCPVSPNTGWRGSASSHIEQFLKGMTMSTNTVKDGTTIYEEQSVTPVSEGTTMDVREIQPSRGASIIASDFSDHANLDAVAGSEFVDDRIRLRD